MPLGADQRIHTDPRPDGISRPAQIPTPWATLIDAGGMDDIDAAPSVNPDLVTDADHHIGKVGKRGTTLRLRMRYDDADAGTITNPQVVVFGRYDSSDQWMILLNKAGSRISVIAVDVTNDVTDATDKWTLSHQENNAYDLEGCDEVIVLVEVAYAETGAGDASLALLEAKII